MKRNIIIITLILIVGGCYFILNGQDQKDNLVSKETLYKNINIQTNILNETTKEETYNVYLLTPGSKVGQDGEAITDNIYGPFKIDETGSVNISLKNNNNIEWYIKKDGKYAYALQVVVVTKEDIYLRNPINKTTYIYFSKNNDEATKAKYPYYSKRERINIDLNNKYPKEFLSLTFKKASFVVKLDFADDFKPTDAYMVSIVKNNETGTSISRITKAFQYWDTPFYESDNLDNIEGKLMVRDINTNAEIRYEGYPLAITFTEGKCNQGNIIKLKLINNE